MGKRILSGAIVTVLAVTAILTGGTLLAGVLLIVSCTAYRELCKAMAVHKKSGMDFHAAFVLDSSYTWLYNIEKPRKKMIPWMKGN